MLQGHRIDGSGRGSILVRAVQLLPAGKGQIVRVRLARTRSAREQMIAWAELGRQGRRRPVAGERRKDDRGHGGGVQTVHLPRSLVGAEKEPLIPEDRAAQRHSELVLFQIRFGLPGGIPEERIGIENVVAHKFPGGAVIPTLSAPCDHVGAGHHARHSRRRTARSGS